MHASASTLKPLDAVRHSALRFRSVDALSRTEHSTFGWKTLFCSSTRPQLILSYLIFSVMLLLFITLTQIQNIRVYVYFVYEYLYVVSVFCLSWRSLWTLISLRNHVLYSFQKISLYLAYHIFANLSHSILSYVMKHVDVVVVTALTQQPGGIKAFLTHRLLHRLRLKLLS